MTSIVKYRESRYVTVLDMYVYIWAKVAEKGYKCGHKKRQLWVKGLRGQRHVTNSSTRHPAHFKFGCLSIRAYSVWFSSVLVFSLKTYFTT